MPLLRYILQVVGEDDPFSETDYFRAYPAREAEEIVGQEIVLPLNSRRTSLGEPLIELVKVEVLNPYVHAHSWIPGKWDRFALKLPIRCARCGATGYRKLNLFTGPYGPMILNPPWDKNKFYLCKDPLKELPKTLVFG